MGDKVRPRQRAHVRAGCGKTSKLIGWTMEQGNPDGALVSFPHEIDSETRYYPVVHDAKWITFDTAGGLLLSPDRGYQRDTVNAPTPVRTGYTFLDRIYFSWMEGRAKRACEHALRGAGGYAPDRPCGKPMTAFPIAWSICWKMRRTALMAPTSKSHPPSI